MTGRLPEPSNTEHYRKIPFQFTEECIVFKKNLIFLTFSLSDLYTFFPQYHQKMSF